MIVVDVNLLIYAVNQDFNDRHKARSWLEAAVSGTETKPMSVDAAFDVAMLGCSSLRGLCPNLPHATCKLCVI